MPKLSDLLDRKREIETALMDFECLDFLNVERELETVNAQIEALADKEDRRMR